MKRATLFSVFAASAAILLLSAGCTDVDPAGEYDRYTEIVGEEEPVRDDSLCPAEKRDLSGLYFVRLEHSISSADHIMFSFDISGSGDTYDITVQPLKTDITKDKIPKVDENGDPICRTDKDGNIVYEDETETQCRYETVNAPRDDARAPAGDSIVINDVEMSDAGEVYLELDQIRVDGEANSFSWGDILADIQLTLAACAEEPEFFCGTADLQVFEPIPFPRETGTLGAVLVETVDTSAVAPASCNGDPE